MNSQLWPCKLHEAMTSRTAVTRKVAVFSRVEGANPRGREDCGRVVHFDVVHQRQVLVTGRLLDWWRRHRC